ncbi:hemin uptake protein HemP [Halomonas sp. H2]|uniref:hemin uptake protein HemP n=1 Tax=Halomonas sp. H2 TaxID=261936 RepID=UPI003CE939A5
MLFSWSGGAPTLPAGRPLTNCTYYPKPRLLGSSGQLIIHHEQRRYVLRRTKSGKLILNA